MRAGHTGVGLGPSGGEPEGRMCSEGERTGRGSAAVRPATLARPGLAPAPRYEVCGSASQMTFSCGAACSLRSRGGWTLPRESGTRFTTGVGWGPGVRSSHQAPAPPRLAVQPSVRSAPTWSPLGWPLGVQAGGPGPAALPQGWCAAVRGSFGCASPSQAVSACSCGLLSGTYRGPGGPRRCRAHGDSCGRVTHVLRVHGGPGSGVFAHVSA